MQHEWIRPGSEVRFENALRKTRLKYKANAKLDRYEVDFVVEPFIVVEIDGYSHCTRGKAEQDARKTAHLERLGYRVLRFTGLQVEEDVRGCIEQLKEAQRAQQLNPACGRDFGQLSPWQVQLQQLVG